MATPTLSSEYSINDSWFGPKLSVIMENSDKVLQLSTGKIIADGKQHLVFAGDTKTEKQHLHFFGRNIERFINLLPEVHYKTILSQFNSNANILEVSCYNGKPYCFIKRWFFLPEDSSTWIPTTSSFQIDISMMTYIVQFLKKHYQQPTEEEKK